MFYGHEKKYTSFEIFSKAIADYIDYYNNRRIQAKTKWMPPAKFREASMMKTNYSVQITVSRKLGTYHISEAAKILICGVQAKSRPK